MNDLYVLGAFLLVVLVIDWRQTLTIAKNPDKWFEMNPILGKHPSVQKVHVYFLCVIAASAFVLSIVPRPWSIVIAVIACLVELAVVIRNDRKGIST